MQPPPRLRAPFPSATLGLGLLLSLLSPTVCAADSGEVLRLAGCERAAGEYRATLDDTLVLARAFLDPARPEEESVREAIRQQLKFVWGYLRTNAAALAREHLVLSAEEPEITLRAVRPGRYGQALVIDWAETKEDLRITDDYTKRAVARGRVGEEDEALVVDYRIVFKVAICGEARPEASTLEVLLPHDPWLYYWHVAAADRRHLRYGADDAITNPCNDDDFADLPHPYYIWYDWQPDRVGPDVDGKPFDCRALLRPGRDYEPRTIALARLHAPTGRLESLRRGLGGTGTLGATVLIGVLDHTVTALDLAPLARTLDGKAPLGALARRGLEGAPEHGVGKLLALLRDLERVMQVRAHRATVEDGYLAVTVEGTLRRSHRPLRLRALVGYTDIFGPVPPRHWPILRRALVEDPIVVYAGHSGIGENFRLANIEDKTGMARGALRVALDPAPFRLAAFLSCYSYMYFGRDQLPAPGAAPGPGVDRAFIYTGTPFTMGDTGALAVLDLVDQALDPKAPAPSLRYVLPSDFLIVKEYGAAAPPPATSSPPAK